MNEKTLKLIKTEEFINKFPSQVKRIKLNDYYSTLLPKISYRTFRYYVTNQLMPRPVIANKKSEYKDTSEMYKRLYLVWYLIHFRRQSIQEIKQIVESYHSELELDFILYFLDRKNFLKNLSSSGDVKKAIHCDADNVFEETELTDSILEALFDLIKTETAYWIETVYDDLESAIHYEEGYSDRIKLEFPKLIDRKIERCNSIIKKTENYVVKLKRAKKDIKNRKTTKRLQKELQRENETWKDVERSIRR